MKKRVVTRFIEIHHTLSGKHWTTIKHLWKWHVKEKDWDAIGYHVFIDGYGEKWRCRSHDMEGAHDRRHNKDAYAICLAGNFNKEVPNYIQLVKLKEEIAFAKKLFPTIEKVIWHRSTHNPCPGKYFQQMFPDGVAL